MNEGEREGKKHMMQNPSGNCCPVLSQVKTYARVFNDLIHCELIGGIFCFAELHKRKTGYQWQMSTLSTST